MQDDREVIAACLRAMHLDPTRVSHRQRLPGAGSGSGVHLLRLDGRDVVLKITRHADRAGHLPARRELRFYRELAPRLPVLVPRLLGSADGDQFTCLLLSAARPASHANGWSRRRWLEVAAQLGRLHGTAIAAAEASTWLQHTRPLEQHDAAGAMAYWRAAGCADLAEPLFSAAPDLAACAASLPACLVHGDCHTGNLLVDETGDLVWADWQQVGIGHGPEDLALLWQRAGFDGARPPRSAMLTVYARARGLAPEAALVRATVAAELLLLLLAWPQHLTTASPSRCRVMIRRLHRLAVTWNRGKSSPDDWSAGHDAITVQE
jgi:aminoglycoside phosphotransferase (APT) family kinase protein